MSGKRLPNNKPQVSLRLEVEEKERLEQLAEEAGLTVAEYIRKKIFDIPLGASAEEAKLVKRLVKLQFMLDLLEEEIVDEVAKSETLSKWHSEVMQSWGY